MSTPFGALNLKQSPTMPPEPVWRLSVAQYHQMVRLGILTTDDPVELLEGWLVYKMPKNPPQRVATKLTFNGLTAIVPPGWYVDTQEPITLETSEPEPDVMVIQGDTRDYSDRHPNGQEVALVIEVADSSLERDRSFKKRIYAQAEIPTYWIIDLNQWCIEVYSDPIAITEPPTYQQQQIYTSADAIAVVIAGAPIGSLPVQQLLP